MAHLTRTRRGELLKGVFAVLREHPEGIQAKDVLARVEQIVPPTDYEQAIYPGSGVRRFEKVVRFQTVNAVKAGWMTKDKGLWVATDEGLDADAHLSDPTDFMATAEMLYADWARQRPKRRPLDAEPSDASTDDAEDDEGVDEEISITVETAVETAFTEVTEYLGEMPPYRFQTLVAGLLRGMGYHVEWEAPPGPDRGIDIIAFRDPLGTEDPRIKVQVKREKEKTNVKGLRAFMSVLNPGDIGVFVALGGFTSDASAEARHSETRRVTLIDVGRLFDLWVKHYDDIPEDVRSLLPLKPVYYLSRDEIAD